MPSEWNGKLKKEEFVDFSRITVAVNPAGGVIASGCPGNIRNLSPQLSSPGHGATKEKGYP
jgi:hypothetical protein